MLAAKSREHDFAKSYRGAQAEGQIEKDELALLTV
jgi:hypothetical protein